MILLVQGQCPVSSVESPLSVSSLKNCSVKTSVDCQPSVLRIDESLSPASLDSVIAAERDIKVDKYTSISPIRSPECLQADQVPSDFSQCCICSSSFAVRPPSIPFPK